MFAKTTASTKTPVTGTQFMYTGLAALSAVDLFKTVRCKFAYQNDYALSDYTWTNSENGKGLFERFIEPALERIFVRRRLNQWRLSKLS